MNRLITQKRTQIVSALVEGNSIRATCRVTGASENTVTRLLVDLGKVCADYQGGALRDLPCCRVQCDEIRAFVYAKEKNLPEDKRGQFGYGDAYTLTAICADTKLVLTWLVGPRDNGTACRSLVDVARRMRGRIQLTTDGANFYEQAAWEAHAVPPEQETRHSPPHCTGTETQFVHGEPDPEHISTSYADRQNLTTRMTMRRFTRLTNALSKRVYNLSCAVALHFMYYNLARPHQTLMKRHNGRPTTPAMEAGMADRVWSIEEIIGLLEAREPSARETARAN